MTGHKRLFLPVDPGEDPRTLHTYAEVARYLRVSESTISQLANAGKFRKVVVCWGRTKSARLYTGDVLVHVGVLHEFEPDAPVRPHLVPEGDAA